MWVDVYWTGHEKEFVGEHRAREEQRRILDARILEETIKTEEASATRSTSHNSSAQCSASRRTASHGSSARASSTRASSTPSLRIAKKASISNFLKSLAGKKKDKSNEEEGENGKKGDVASSGSTQVSSGAWSLEALSEDVTMHPALIADTSSVYSEPGLPGPRRTPPDADNASVIYNLEPSAHLAQRTEVYEEMTPYGGNCGVLLSSEPESDPIPIPQTSNTIRNSKTANWPFPKADSPVKLVPGLKIAPPIRLTSSSSPNNPNAWRTPEEWDVIKRNSNRQNAAVESIMEKVDKHLDEFGHNTTCSSTIATQASTAVTKTSTTVTKTSTTVTKTSTTVKEASARELPEFREDVTRMALTSPKDIVTRLKEIDSTDADRIIEEELVKERNQWMLSVLHHLDYHGGKEPRYKNFCSDTDSSSSKAQKLLTLFESGSTTQYLAAIHADKKVYHMSSTPLSHTEFPNVRSVLVPCSATSSFPFASQTFDFVYSHSITSMFRADEMPKILKKVAKALKPNGVMFLTLIDPLPVKWSLGPLMQAWMDKHLISNLNKRGFCTEPMQVFTEWMGEAKLRGSGSIAHASTSLALPASGRQPRFLDDPFVEGPLVGSKETEEKEQLRTMIGHSLWLQIWGPHVICDAWWWDDPEIVEECLTLKTFWRYHQVEGVKDSSKQKKF
ncbi:hypothetical protein BGZ63DRAFT_426827 [Mariannaea sp. PMI_226]|nr:hypothetical protein BGZ63DRAFT_426827 [Mariannaea sp. PMI_226]